MAFRRPEFGLNSTCKCFQDLSRSFITTFHFVKEGFLLSRRVSIPFLQEHSPFQTSSSLSACVSEHAGNASASPSAFICDFVVFTCTGSGRRINSEGAMFPEGLPCRLMFMRARVVNMGWCPQLIASFLGHSMTVYR